MIYVVSFGILILILVIITIPMIWWDRVKKRRFIDEAFEGRVELDDRVFFERYFEGQGVPFFVAAKVRSVLEKALEADLSRLSSEDDLGKNLNFFFQADSMADVEMVEALQEEFGVVFEGDDFVPHFPSSVDGIVNLVWRKVAEKDSQRKE